MSLETDLEEIPTSYRELNCQLLSYDFTDNHMELVAQKYYDCFSCLRLKESDVTNDCIAFVNQLVDLEELGIQDTRIDKEGLQQLTLFNLELLVLDSSATKYGFDFLKRFSEKFPRCEILVKGYGVFENGKFDGTPFE